MAWLLLGAAIAGGQQAASAPTSPNDVVPAPASPSPLAERLLTDARVLLGRHASIAAKIRHKIDLFGHRLVGTGVYLQYGKGEAMRSRYELKIQAAGRLSSVLQVGDGRYLWIERQVAGDRTVSWIDVRRVWSEAKNDAGQAMPPHFLPAIGGLSELLDGLDANFQFTQVVENHLTGQAVYTLLGEWRRERLAAMLPGQKQAIAAGQPARLDELPEQVPHEVRIVLGRHDLFPYVIDYRRSGPAEGAGQGGRAAADGRSLMRMQFFEVHLGGQIETREFVYSPGDVQGTDVTDAFLKKLRGRKTSFRATRVNPTTTLSR